MKKNKIFAIVLVILAIIAIMFYSGKLLSITGLQYYYPTPEVSSDGSSLRLYWDVLPPAVLFGQPSTAECSQTLWRYIGVVKINSNTPITPTLTGSGITAGTLQPCGSQYPNTYYYVVGCPGAWQPSTGYTIDTTTASPRYYKEFGKFANPSAYKAVKVVYSALETPGDNTAGAYIISKMCEDVSKETQYAAYPVQAYNLVWGSVVTPIECGNFLCDASETFANCPTDCKAAATCGDGTCNNGENTQSCIMDCPNTQTCGDGACSGSENYNICPSDCPSPPPPHTAPNIIEQIVDTITAWLCNNAHVACKV